MMEGKMPEMEVEEKEPMTERELNRWMIWAAVALAVCTATSCIWAWASSVRDREAAAILQVESETVLEFYLNRKGTILGAMGDASDVLKEHTLEEGIEKLLQGLSDHGNLGDGGAVIFTLRSFGTDRRINLHRFAEEIHVYAELFLRKRHSGGAVYVAVLDEPDRFEEVAGKYGVSLGKAALAENLLSENAALGSTDLERFLRMPVDRISKEVLDEKYDTSFILVTAKQVYMKQPEEEMEEETELTPTEAEVSFGGETAETIQEELNETVAPEEPTQAPTEGPTQASAEEPTQAPTEGPTQAPTEESTQAAAEEPTQAPTEGPTQASAEEAAQAATEEPTQASAEEPAQEAAEVPAPGQGILAPVQSGNQEDSIIQQVIPVAP